MSWSYSTESLQCIILIEDDEINWRKCWNVVSLRAIKTNSLLIWIKFLWLGWWIFWTQQKAFSSYYFFLFPRKVQKGLNEIFPFQLFTFHSNSIHDCENFILAKSLPFNEMYDEEREKKKNQIMLSVHILLAMTKKQGKTSYISLKYKSKCSLGVSMYVCFLMEKRRNVKCKYV